MLSKILCLTSVVIEDYKEVVNNMNIFSTKLDISTIFKGLKYIKISNNSRPDGALCCILINCAKVLTIAK